jgi:hypothetical protein
MSLPLLGVLAACSTTLPDESSVHVTLSTVEMRAGAPIEATLVNATDHTIGHGTLPCHANVAHVDTGERIGPEPECDQPLLLLQPGGASRFVIAAPAEPGEYRIQIDVSDEDRDPPLPGLPLSIRSAAFEVVP